MGWRPGQAYSDDLRQRVLAAEGRSRAVAARFGVSVSYVIKARQRRERTGETSARRQGSRRPPILAPLHETIRAHVEANDDHTLDEMRAWLQEAHGVRVSVGAMWNTLRRLGLTQKTYGPPRLQW